MITLNLKNPEKHALSYKNEKVYLKSYKLSSTLQNIAKDRNLSFVVDVNDIVDNPKLFGRIRKFINICNKYGIKWELASSGIAWKKRNDKELKFVRLFIEG